MPWCARASRCIPHRQGEHKVETTIYCIEFMESPLGIWDHKWFLAEQDAEEERDRMIREEGFRYDPEGSTQFCIMGPYSVSVDLTPNGLVAFANNWAIDRQAC
jgi:hypothetical protein